MGVINLGKKNMAGTDTWIKVLFISYVVFAGVLDTCINCIKRICLKVKEISYKEQKIRYTIIFFTDTLGLQVNNKWNTTSNPSVGLYFKSDPYQF